MRQFHSYLLALLILLPISVTSPAADGPQPQPGISPMMQEIQTALVQEAAALEALHKELAGAPTAQDALAILRRITQRKQDTEVAILRTRAAYARKAGHVAAVDRIEQAIERILNPTPAEADPELLRQFEALRDGGQHHE